MHEQTSITSEKTSLLRDRSRYQLRIRRQRIISDIDA
jgi:hypothetical protein